jgi:hypothetical protein
MFSRWVLFSLSIIFLVSSINAVAGTENTPKPFNDGELKEFCHELPIVLSSMNDKQREKFFYTVYTDYSRTPFPKSVWDNPRLSLQPQRIAYILNHVILAGVIQDMGGFGEGQLSFMRSQREKVISNPKISKKEKEHILAELNESIDHLKTLIVQTESIPKSELLLIWKEKDTLNSILRGKIPIQKKEMARQ